MLKKFIKRLPPFRALIEERDAFLHRIEIMEGRAANRDAADAALCYSHDGMKLTGKNTSFLDDPEFMRAYRIGMNSGHHIGRAKGSNKDIHIEWRIHLSCWAANHALRLPGEGDFVECGVNTGITSLAICNYVAFEKTGKSFFLFDTFNGIPEHQMSETELDARRKMNAESYSECYEIARRNFAPYPNVQLIKGEVPGSLRDVAIERVSYLHLDMNIAAPELAAIEFFWDKLVQGAVVLLDDYGWQDYVEQYRVMNEFANRQHVSIATLPTGQGLLLKP